MGNFEKSWQNLRRKDRPFMSDIHFIGCDVHKDYSVFWMLDPQLGMGPVEKLPEQLKGRLPTIEEIEAELSIPKDES